MNKAKARLRRGLKAKAIQRRLSNRPRIVVWRSLINTYAHIVITGEKGDIVLVSASTVDKEIKVSLKGTKVEQAKMVGKLLAKRALEKKLKDVAFDRSGYKYHGRIKALAEGAREDGLNF